MTTLPSSPLFGQGLDGGQPGLWANSAAVDGDRPPWSRAPLGASFWRRASANHQQQYLKVKDDARDDDWVLVEGIISERFAYTDFADGGTTTGTVSVNGTIPVGAYLDKAQVHNVTGFTGDTSATIQISGGVDVTTDVDGYTTGTPSVFTTASAVTVGVPSGVRTVTTAGIPLITITSGSDWGLVTAGALTVTLFYKV
jgi:hypothetical protein